MNPLRSLIFVNTKDMADQVAETLKANGLHAAVLSGDVPQTVRLRLLADFTEGRLPILVATDVAARGLHIPDVSHVFNYDLPQNAEDYVHRIGRTARAGAAGDAISFACEKYVFGLPEIEEFIGHQIPSAVVTPEMLPPLTRPSRSARAERRPERGRGRAPRKERGERRERAARAPKHTAAPKPDAAPAHAAADRKPAPGAEAKPTKPIPKLPKAKSKTVLRRFERPAVG